MKIGKLIKKIWNVQTNNYVVKNESDLMRNLERLNRWFKKDINDAINHERKHYSKSKELGYSLKYGVQIIKRTLFGIDLSPAIFPFVGLEENMLPEDKVKIALAPKHPSWTDYCIAHINYYGKVKPSVKGLF